MACDLKREDKQTFVGSPREGGHPSQVGQCMWKCGVGAWQRLSLRTGEAGGPQGANLESPKESRSQVKCPSSILDFTMADVESMKH